MYNVLQNLTGKIISTHVPVKSKNGQSLLTHAEQSEG